ncbi:conjugal transfer protein TraF [Reinekea sp.]|jgi:hypothetical protein|uniref:conjugal transfer protein TraF n=1 Tax=Reinekea sp. TaxID=1970455 RepID=UPI002A7F187B|nr:conjugal transfer protein TraF [Reinekea sp.]
MKKTLVSVAVVIAGSTFATPFTGNSAPSNAMGNTGVASANAQDAVHFNPALLADYGEGVGFSMTLPSAKISVDDSDGLIQNGEVFFTGNNWDNFQQIDAAEFNKALFGDEGTGGTEVSMQEVIAEISLDIGKIQTAINDITSATSLGTAPTSAQVTALNTASTGLTTHSDLLDEKTGRADTQATNLTTTVIGAQSGLLGFNNSPLQLGLGFDLLNVALPSQNLGMALSISTTTTVGVNISISNLDFDPVNQMSDDLTEITARAKSLTTSIAALAAANQALTAHLAKQPDSNDYTLPAQQSEFEADITAWGNILESLASTVDTARQDTQAKQLLLTGFTGNFVTGGTVTPPDEFELTSVIDIVGANISELGVSLAKRFVIGGQDMSIGITPKLQSINIFEKTIGLAIVEDEISTAGEDPAGYFLDNTTRLFRANIDVGVAKSWDFHGKLRAGAALKDIIPWTLESNTGAELLIRPRLRIGGAHETKFTKLAVDLDITENKPLKYGVPTRYLGIGAELNAWRQLSLRAGYRTNLSAAESGVVSGGLGITPFGVGIQASVWAKPRALDSWSEVLQDAGLVVQTSFNF